MNRRLPLGEIRDLLAILRLVGQPAVSCLQAPSCKCRAPVAAILKSTCACTACSRTTGGKKMAKALVSSMLANARLWAQGMTAHHKTSAKHACEDAIQIHTHPPTLAPLREMHTFGRDRGPNANADDSRIFPMAMPRSAPHLFFKMPMMFLLASQCSCEECKVQTVTEVSHYASR